jgi:hypothetical protein
MESESTASRITIQLCHFESDLTTDPERQRTLLHVSALQHRPSYTNRDILQAADSTAGISEWKVGDMSADTCRQSFDPVIHWFLVEDATANALVLLLYDDIGLRQTQ